MKLVRSKDRYLTELDWLKSYHSFSFGEHYFPDNKGWGKLRVINEDYIAPGGKFETHPHRDMEIITYLVQGELFHQDSAGNEYTIKAGDLQRISAGSGIKHSEKNSSKEVEAILLQIWIKPNEKQTKPIYDQTSFNKEGKLNKLQLLASESGRDESISIKQDLDLYASILEKNQSLTIQNKKSKSWLQVISGKLQVNQTELEAGDALGFEDLTTLELMSLEADSHFLFFDISG